MLAICLVNPSSITKKQSKIKERTEMRFWWVNQPITSSWMLKSCKIWSQKWLKHRGELPDGTTQERGVHRDMKYNLHGTVWFTGSNSGSGITLACMMLHCWMAACCRRLASSCSRRALWHRGSPVTTSSGILRALWQAWTAWTFGFRDSISDKRC